MRIRDLVGEPAPTSTDWIATAPAHERIAFARRKRALDVIVAGFLLTLSLPFVLVVAIAIKADGGPVLFRQTRIGRGGRRFYLVKLRTMVEDAEEVLRADPAMRADHVSNCFKLHPELDPRITKVGRFLRSSSLDELPQLVAVIKGEMSMVGPRPVVEPELVEYEKRGALDLYLAVRPGLTGLWQVSGRSALGYSQRVQCDRAYVEGWTLRSDLKILVRTVGVVLRRSGAY